MLGDALPLALGPSVLVGETYGSWRWEEVLDTSSVCLGESFGGGHWTRKRKPGKRSRGSLCCCIAASLTAAHAGRVSSGVVQYKSCGVLLPLPSQASPGRQVNECGCGCRAMTLEHLQGMMGQLPPGQTPQGIPFSSPAPSPYTQLVHLRHLGKAIYGDADFRIEIQRFLALSHMQCNKQQYGAIRGSQCHRSRSYGHSPPCHSSH